MMDGTQRGSSGFMSRVYRSDLRPAILFGAFLALLWSLVAGISSFRNVPFFNSNQETNLGTLYIILGCIGMAAVAIEAFGIFSVASRRFAAVRLYAFLSILVTLLIAAFYIIQTVIHFSFKNDIINLCTNINAGDRIFFTGFFGPIDGGIVTPLEALDWCDREYDRDSFSNIVALLVVSAVAALFAFFVFAYLRQLRNPTSAANSSRQAVPMNNLDFPYNPSYLDPLHNPDSFVPPYSKPGSDYSKPGSDYSKPPAYNGGNSNDGGFIDHKDPWSSGGH